MAQNASEQTQQKVLVFDFGAQYAQLIARRVRDLHVYSEIVPCDITADEVREMAPSALILSGGPASVYAEDAPTVDPAIYELGLPILGFCYGHQVTAVTLGGEVGHSEIGEYGPATLARDRESALFNATPLEQTVWMSHRDAVSRVPEGFAVTASTSVCPVAAMENAERRIYTTQFHPEVKHTEYGQQLLKNFLFDICGLEAAWTMDNLVETMTDEFRASVGEDRVILALSGGVDSSVVAALGARAVGRQMTCVFINHGLLRKGEPEQVEEVFTKQFDVDFVHVHAEERYAALLDGVTDPEEKRRIIGTQFWNEFFAVAKELEQDGRPVKYLAQGTIYPDIIESGARKTGGKTATIKSHHNLIPFPEGVHFDLIEPLDHFFKDEVRELGLALGLPEHIVYRQPFPGPGLAIRIIGAVSPEKLEILKNADAIVREELDAYNARLFEQTGERNSEHSCWQYFCVLPDIKSVGVMGDERTYARPVILRAVESSDAMTADWARLPYEVLARISGRIVAEVPGINRVPLVHPGVRLQGWYLHHQGPLWRSYGQDHRGCLHSGHVHHRRARAALGEHLLHPGRLHGSAVTRRLHRLGEPARGC